MKKTIMPLVCATMLMARIDPFFLPGESSSSKASGISSSFVSAKSASSVASSTQVMLKSAASSSNHEALDKEAITFDYGFLQVAIFDDRIELHTKDRLKKHFLLDNPKKIVLDFATKRRFASKKNKIKHPKFTNITLGAHANYYRLAIAFKGACKNRLQRDGATLILFCE